MIGNDSAIRFLVADDVELMRKSIQTCLERLGYSNIVLAANGREAMELLEEQPFDCIISDWRMPYHSGLELLQHVRATPRLRNIKFMLVTANSEIDNVNEAISEGVDQFLVKPFNLGNLQKKVQALLRGQSLMPMQWRPKPAPKQHITSIEVRAATEPALILVVDDISSNLDVLVGILKDDYRIKAARSGMAAIKICQGMPLPDLILLDVMMPEMDGFLVCQQLKADPVTERIPIIFLTAKSEVVDITRGFELGAVDYIAKPFVPGILKARVATHLHLKRTRDDLEDKIDSLLENARLKEDLERISRHDIKSPLSAIIGTTELLLENDKLGFEPKEMIGQIRSASLNVLSMINRSLELYKMETGHYQLNPQPFDMVHTLLSAINDARVLAHANQIKVVFTPPEAACLVLGEELLCYTLLGNLLKNAVEASKEHDEVTVNLSVDAAVEISIHNRGTVPAEIRNNLFDKHVTLGKAEGSGLGTYSAKLLANIQQGDIRFDSSDASGTTFYVTLPKALA
ncbi:response regulator [Shewanella sp. A3A]|nr:response regulator [Shewanella ferrihydritica]